MQDLPMQTLSMGHLGPSWGHLGAILGPSWAHRGPNLEPPWAILGPCGALLGLPGTNLHFPPTDRSHNLKKLVFRCGETLCLRDRPTVAVSRATVGSVFGAIVGYFDASCSHFGAISGHSGPILGPSWAGLGPSWLSISAKFAGANYA